MFAAISSNGFKSILKRIWYNKYVTMRPENVENELFYSPGSVIEHLASASGEFGISSYRYMKLIDIHYYSGVDLVRLTVELEKQGFLEFSPYLLFCLVVEEYISQGTSVSYRLAKVLGDSVPRLLEVFDTDNPLNLNTIADTMRTYRTFAEHEANKKAERQIKRMILLKGY